MDCGLRAVFAGCCLGGSLRDKSKARSGDFGIWPEPGVLLPGRRRLAAAPKPRIRRRLSAQTTRGSHNRQCFPETPGVQAHASAAPPGETSGAVPAMLPGDGCASAPGLEILSLTGSDPAYCRASACAVRAETSGTVGRVVLPGGGFKRSLRPTGLLHLGSDPVQARAAQRRRAISFAASCAGSLPQLFRPALQQQIGHRRQQQRRK